MKKIAVIVFMLVLSCVASADEIAIKGLSLGMSTQDFLKVYPHKDAGWTSSASGGSCHKMSADIDRCDYTQDIHDPQSAFTIAGAPATISLLFEHNLLVEIYVSINNPDLHFGDVLAALTSKFANPTSIFTPTSQNAYGATVKNAEVLWHLPTGDITLIKYVTITESSLLIRSRAYQAQLDAKENAKKKDL